MFCRKCGAEMQEGAKFCRKCGMAVAGSEQAVAVEPEQVVAKKKSGLGLKIGIGVIAAAIVVGGVSFFAMGGSTEKRLAEQAEQEAAQAAGDGETEAASPLGIGEVAAGQIITFGSYEQDGNTANGKEPIEWYVLEASNGEAVLLSVYLLDCQPYHETWEDITWEDCPLRSWLNSEFYNTAFSAEEQQAIINANVVNEDNPFWGTEGGNNTADKVWLLSLGEIERYFHIDRNVYWNDFYNGNMNWAEYAVYCYGQDHRVCAKPTAYAEARVLYVFSEKDLQYDGIDMSFAVGSGLWWLRSPGSFSSRAAYVSNVGGVFLHGYVVDDIGGVRPAIKMAY